MIPPNSHTESNQYLEALQDQNPWQRLNRVPGTLAWPVRRPIADHLWETLLSPPPSRYQVVLGPRRVGKTVAMYQTIQRLMDKGIPANRLWFLRLDHPLLMHYELNGWAKALIRRFDGTNENPLYLFLDEVNYSRNWDKWLKSFHDEQWPLRIVATSSAAASLQNRTVESGIGRWSEQFLMPYSFQEYLVLSGKEAALAPPQSPDLFGALLETIAAGPDTRLMESDLRVFLLIGGFPELIRNIDDDNYEKLVDSLLRSQQVLRSEAVQRVAGMDIPQVFDIRQPLTLERLVYVLANQICQQASTSSLSRDLEIARPTVENYINYLEKSYLLFTAPNYSRSEAAVQRRGKKVYFVDGAVRNAALQRGVAPLSDSREMGFLLENAVATHLYALSKQSDGRLYYWRDNQVEVDFVYTGGGPPIAFEVAKSQHNLRGLHQIQQRFPETKGRCFLVTAESNTYEPPEAATDGIGRIPMTAFLLTMGHLTNRALRLRLGVAT